jgi:hypothetical protein
MKTVLMPIRQFVAEHKKLVKILEKGNKKQQVAEAKDQKAELLKMLKK